MCTPAFFGDFWVSICKSHFQPFSQSTPKKTAEVQAQGSLLPRYQRLFCFASIQCRAQGGHGITC